MTSAPSDTFGNLLRYYEVPPYSLPYTLSEAHVTAVLLYLISKSRHIFDTTDYIIQRDIGG